MLANTMSTFTSMTVEENLLMGLASKKSGGVGDIPREVYEMFPVLKQMLGRRGIHAVLRAGKLVHTKRPDDSSQILAGTQDGNGGSSAREQRQHHRGHEDEGDDELNLWSCPCSLLLDPPAATRFDAEAWEWR